MKTLEFKNKKYQVNTKESGFTLLETLIAIFIMTVAFTALLTLMTTSMFSARYANNEITATYLAQEAMDYIRNDRDTTAFLNSNWSVGGITSFIGHYGDPSLGTECFDSSTGCMVDANLSVVNGCVGVCPSFFYESAPGGGAYYVYSASSTTRPTSFVRTVKMDLVTPDELAVTVLVSWQNGSVSRTQELKASLLKWQ
jgi:prepilin-type N-terminal cleavage/methylation domain-containing protein